MVLRNPRRHRPQAFTLIELLVVVAIIALLISILLPSLQRAKSQARQLICGTQLRTQGQAAILYAEDNNGILPRGLEKFTGSTMSEYHIFWTSLPVYMGWDGLLKAKLRNNKIMDIVGDQDLLWSGKRAGGWTNPMGANDWWRGVLRVFESIEQYQCPDYPDVVYNTDDHWFPQLQDGSPVDYVASAFVFPYTQYNINHDTALEWVPDGENVGQTDRGLGYSRPSKISDFPPGMSTAGIIYVTEAHTSMPFNHDACRLHHVFLGSQLPFGGQPRIANDQRHPGGINALFFDGHVRTFDLHELDPGYPNTIDKRLRWFTAMPDSYYGG